MITSQDASILIRLSYETSNVTKCLLLNTWGTQRNIHHPSMDRTLLWNQGSAKSWFAVGAGLAVDFALPLHGPLQADCLAEIEWTTGHSNKPHLFFVSDEDRWYCWCRLCKYCNLICGVWKCGRTSKGRAVVSKPGTRVDGYSHHKQESWFSK
jgi:hypothetical protein